MNICSISITLCNYSMNLRICGNVIRPQMSRSKDELCQFVICWTITVDNLYKSNLTSTQMEINIESSASAPLSNCVDDFISRCQNIFIQKNYYSLNEEWQWNHGS